MSTFADLKVHELRSELAVRGIDTTGTKSVLIRRLCDFEAEKQATQRNKRRRDPEDDQATALENLRKMGVRELREEAVARGVSAGGTKKEILERIAAVIEKTGVIGDGDDGVVEDLQVKNEEVGSDCLKTISAIEILKKMGVKELREQAGLRWISKSGTKRELLEKINAALVEKEDITEDVKVEEVVRVEKLVTATKKGAAVLDQWLPEQYKATYHVLQCGGDIYDATLNQTNVGDNNNKYYIIQVLESDNGGTFMVYNRWGRVGVKGQNKLHGPYTSEHDAIHEFELKFHSKTRNHWSDRKQFTYHPKCYSLLEMDYEGTGNEAVETRIENPLTVNKKSKLDPRLAQFISLICNISMMEQHMLMIGYNAEKLPLGKLSKSTILKGYDVLRKISIVVGQSDRKELERLSGEFYTVIPHDFGFKKMREFVIDTPQKLKSKLAMVEALGEIEIATKLLKDDVDDMDDPLYSCYQHLNCDLIPLEVSSNEFSMINKYLINTHAKTHSNYSVNIEQIFEVSRKAEDDWFKKFSGIKNRMLLWHGSRLTNWAGILSQGLRIAPPEAPVTGYMFGKGVYFADMFSKSANYCCATSQARTGVLLLCEVALGDMAEHWSADYNANNLPDGKMSTKGVGTTEPDSSEFQQLDDGVVVPLGKSKEHSNRKGSLLYNEYIVYNVEQIRMRYVIQVNFNFKR